tara:strand:- start:326 stop:1642 length:1317 start_codon:yes stop_codon:yes gene_type:complete
MASTLIQRTPSGGNRKKWTWSAWIKFSAVPSANTYLWSGYSGSNNTGYLSAYFDNNSQLNIGAWTVVYFNTTRAFRDINAWYHIVIVMDTAQATAANRLKLYVNGVEETAFDSDSRSSISQDSDMGYNSNGVHTIGGYQSSGSAYVRFDGIMSHVHFTDGYAYTPSAFGETDATTGEWKINTSPSVSYGTTGYWIFKDNAGITDQSPNSNNWTATGTLTPTKDCPSNVFATWNILDNYYASATLTNGNTKVATNSSAYSATLTSLGASSGKYYAEFKLIDKGSGYCQIGIKGKQPTATSDGVGAGSDGLAYQLNGNKLLNGSSSSYGTSYDNNDIIGIAMDLDNNRLFFSKNGTFQDSGDPTSSTGAITIPTSSSGFYFMGISDEHNNGTNTWEANFGNGYFGTTAVSSAGTNASGNGIFEYDVPTGYTALSTKGLNE